MFRRLAFRLTVSLTLIVIVVEGISGLINVKHQEKQMLEAMILGADQLSRAITSATWHAMLADHREAAYETMQTIALKQGIKRIRIFNKEGRVMFSTDPHDTDQVDKDAEACSLCHASLQPLVRVDVPSRARIFRGPDGERQLAMITPIYNEPACSQAACHAHPAAFNVLGVLDVALSLERVDDEVSGIEWRGATVMAIHVLLIAVFILFFTRSFVGKPIQELIEGTRAVSAMQLDRPIQVRSSTELGELAHSFNLMRERLKEALAEISRFTQSLESKVEERTRELQIAHEKLEQSARLASLGRLSASVAHEINNPLSGILNLSMLMQRLLTDDGIPRARLEEFRGYLALVIRETRRIGRIVSDLLLFSRGSRRTPRSADLNQIIYTTLSLVEHKLKSMNVQTELHLASALPPMLCDDSQIQEVVLNLVLNAGEATLAHGRGKVMIQTSVDSQRGCLVLKVSDDGEGIAQENVPRIFEPFFTTKEDGKGVGLGLAVVYGIVQSHGGEIEVSSEVGKGTTFTLIFPETSAGSAPPSADRSQQVQPSAQSL
jgi:two-component system NtrC family sensor kinase